MEPREVNGASWVYCRASGCSSKTGAKYSDTESTALLFKQMKDFYEDIEQKKSPHSFKQREGRIRDECGISCLRRMEARGVYDKELDGKRRGVVTVFRLKVVVEEWRS